MDKHIKPLLLLILCLSTASIFADSISLNNGDKISGTIKHMRNGKLLFKTSYGELKIPWAEISSIDSDKTWPVELTNLQLVETKIASKNTSEDTETVDISQIQAINPRQSLYGWKTSGKIVLGIDVKRGNTVKDNYNMAAKAQFDKDKHRITLAAKVVNEKTDHTNTSEDKSQLDLNYSHYFKPRWFYSGSLNYKHDGLNELQDRTYISAGIGHEWLKTDQHKLTVEGGLAYVYENNKTVQDTDYPAAIWDLDYKYKLPFLSAKLFHKHNVLIAISSNNDIFIDSSTGINIPLANQFHLNFQIDWDWKKNANGDKSNSDTAYLTRLGYSF